MKESKYINTFKLNKELYYCPAWYNDKNFFFQLLNQSIFSQKDLLKFGRLYVKYSHINSSKRNEINKYFNYMLQKMQIDSKTHLFKITNNIYNNN